MRIWTILLVVLLASACDNPPPPVPPTDAGPPRDAGPRDAGPPLDGGDAGLDAGMLEVDAGGLDASVTQLDCTVLDDSPLGLGRDRRSGDRAIVLVGGVDEVGAAWVTSPEVSDEIRFVRIPSTAGGALGLPTEVATVGLASSPSLVRSDDGSWMLAWADSSLGNFEVRTAVLEASGALRGSPGRVTDNALRDDLPSLVTRPGGALLAWIQSDQVDFLPHVTVQPLDNAGATSGAARELAALDTIELAAISGAAVALDLREAELHSTTLADDGTPGATRRLDMVSTATGSPGVAYAGATGLAAFVGRVSGVRPEVRVVPLDIDGDARAPVRSVTPAPEQGHSASIAALSGGYAIAYRAVTDPPMVRLALVSPLGDRAGVFDVAPTSEAGGDVALAVASDGRMVVGWRTADGSQFDIEAARVECSDE